MKTEKINTTDTIRNMEVGDVLTFPIERAGTIYTIVWSRLLKERSMGMRWTTAVDMKKGTITVKRIA